MLPSIPSLMSFSSSSSLLHNFSYTTSLAILIFPTLLLILLSKSSKKNYCKAKVKPKLPPGPLGWPIVGNLFQVAFSGKQFFQYIRDLQPLYGPIFTLKMGSRTLIIVASAQLAHQALIQNGETFANRPAEHPTRSIFSCNKFTVNSALYGATWRSLRRNMVQNMLCPGRIKEFFELRNSGMDRLIDRIRLESESNTHDNRSLSQVDLDTHEYKKNTVRVLKNARFAVFCILLSMCFGVPMSDEEIEKVDDISNKVLVTLLPRIDDFLPMFGMLFFNQRKRVMEVRRAQIQTILPLIERRRSMIQNLGSDESAPSFAYLDTLFDLKLEGRKSSTPSDEELVTLCSEFLNGGTDITATAVEWGIGRLIQQPECQSKLFEEIKSTVGDRKVNEKDIEKMEYLNAFTKELLRKHPPTYFLLTHAVTRPTTLAGYDVPENTNVEFFSAGISDDSTVWVDPMEFNPDRFLSGEEDADITGVKGVKMMPFGVGRRICPGLGLGTTHISLMIARMVQEFEWSAPPNVRTLDFSEKLEFTVVMKCPLEAMVRPRT